MTTTAEAATRANVTIATIRTWCRRGVIAATKQAGRWIIDTASLAHRITIGAIKARRTREGSPMHETPKVAFSVETMLGIGGIRRQNADYDRIYLDDLGRFIGLEIEYYKTGSVSYAEFDGRTIANSRAFLILQALGQVYYDVRLDELVVNHTPDAVDFDIKFKYDGYESFDLPALAIDGVKAAIAAL